MHSSVSSRLTHAFVCWLLCALWVSGAVAQPNVQGKWSTLSNTMPINPVHVALLSNGNVLVVAGSGSCPPSLSGCPSGPPYGPSNGSGALLVNPVSGQIIAQFSLSWDMFCNGMVLLADGRAFIDGGTIQYDPFYGQPQVAIFDPATNTFGNVQSMAHGRWYPTVLTLGDGSVMAFSGLDETGSGNNAGGVEFYTVGSGWSAEFFGPWIPDVYPRLHLLPSGEVFYSGAQTTSKLFDPSTITWNTNVANTNYSEVRTYGTSVLLPLTPANNYDPKVIIMGGGNPATNTTEIIDMGASTPSWQYGPNMSEARVELNAVILPNGKVLALGGSVNDEDTTTLSLSADLYDPATNKFSSAGANASQRLYHSVALLLPDATVWVAGGNPSRGTYNNTIEIYQPPYLFNSDGTMATRPLITSAPSAISYSNSFSVTTPDAANISSVVLVRNGTVTHAFGMDQREVGLSFTAGSGTLSVTAPPNGNAAPPGYYMMFILNSSGVPSLASFVQLGQLPAIGFAQVAAATPTSAQVLPVTFPGTQTAGNVNIVVVGWSDTTSTVSSVVDSQGNAYSRAVGPTSGNGVQQSIYYAKNIVAGGNTVTVTFNKVASYPDVRILEYDGLDANGPLDATAGAVGNSSSASSGPATTTSSNELIFGAGTTAGGFSGPGAGFTVRLITSDVDIAEDKVVSTNGSYSAVAPLDGAAWVMQMATFKAASFLPAPTVTGVSPSSGPAAGGTAITINGTNFASGATVTLGGTGATNVVVVSASQITATTAAHAAGAVNVVVTNSDGQSATLANGYTYVAAPTVTGVSPSSGPAAGGTAITINGTNFASGATVTLGGTGATNVVVVSASQITATTAAHAAGAVNVVVTNSDGQSATLANGYTYVPAPMVTGVSPSSGPAAGGTAITINGTNFATGATV